MYQIKIGTIVSVYNAPKLLPQIRSFGFESYEMNLEPRYDLVKEDMSELAKRTCELAEGTPVSSLGYYVNTLMDEDAPEKVGMIIRNAHHFGCDTVSLFAGCDWSKSVPDNIPRFKEVFDELCREAEANGVKLALEGCSCGTTWHGGGHNIAYCDKAWDLIFDAVPSPALGLEWEPCHALEILADPLPQLRKYAHKVFRLHGKDATVDWDVLRAHGLDAGENIIWNRHPGFGDTNWADLFTVLLRAGFSGYCDIEGYHDPVHRGDNEWATQLTALQYLKRCRGGIDFYEVNI